MFDKSAFTNLSYGLYLVTSTKDDKPVGCIVNTFAQVTSNPPQASIAINKENYTTQGILETGRFEVGVLSESTSIELIRTFGFKSSKDVDKFEGLSLATSEQGIPYVNEQACAHFSVSVTQSLDLGSHIFFVGDVVHAENLELDNPMTYAYYHSVKGGRTPKKASVFSTLELEEALAQAQVEAEVASKKALQEKPEHGADKSGRFAWRCSICGHIEYVDELPDDFICPECGAPKQFFERFEVEDK